MNHLIASIKIGKRKAFLRTKPLYESFAPVTEDELARVATKLHADVPAELSAFLLALGYGTLNDEFNFGKDWWHVLETGQLAGHVVFAQDERGNLYTVAPKTGEVHYIDRFAKTYAHLAATFAAFLETASERGFAIMAWAEGLEQAPYATDA